jgi:hypothetical protein
LMTGQGHAHWLTLLGLGSRSRRTRVESAGQISGLQKTDSRRVSRPWQGSPPSRPPPSVA